MTWTISITKLQKQITDKTMLIAKREEWKYIEIESFGWWGALPTIRVINFSTLLRHDHAQHNITYIKVEML